MGHVVCTAQLFPQQRLRLQSAGHEVRLLDSPSGEMLVDALHSADALICLLTDTINTDLLDTASQLQVVANVAVGYENIDVSAAAARGIAVTNTPDVLTQSTADFAFALLLAAARRIAEADASVRSGQFPSWGLQQPLTGADVHGKTWGIVGLGRIGSAVARRGNHGFDMSILYHSRTGKPELERELDATRVPLEDLLARSDFVSLHVPLTAETHHLIDKDALARMKPTAILVNVARGAVVDETALATALQEGVIAGAGLDVFEAEPAVHPGLLACHERLVLAPHLGSATTETRMAMADLAVDNVLAVLAGQPALTRVNGS